MTQKILKHELVRSEYEAKKEPYNHRLQTLKSERHEQNSKYLKLRSQWEPVCASWALGVITENERDAHRTLMDETKRETSLLDSAINGLTTKIEKELPQELNEVEALEQAHERYPELKEAVLQGREAKAEHERLLKQYGERQADNILQKDIALIRGLTDNISQLQSIAKQLDMGADCEEFLKGLEVQHG